MTSCPWLAVLVVSSVLPPVYVARPYLYGVETGQWSDRTGYLRRKVCVPELPARWYPVKG